MFMRFVAAAAHSAFRGIVLMFSPHTTATESAHCTHKKSGIVSQLRRDNCQHLVQQNKTIDEGLCSSLKITQLCCCCSWLTASPSERVEKRTTDQVLGCSVECRRLVFRTAFWRFFPKEVESWAHTILCSSIRVSIRLL